MNNGSRLLLTARHFTDDEDIVKNLPKIVRFKRDNATRPRQNPYRRADLCHRNRANPAKFWVRINFRIDLSKQILVDAV